MSYRCDYCGKGPLKGGSHRHGRGVASHKFSRRAPKSKRILKPNLHTATISINGKKRKMRLCTKCLRKLKSQS